MRKTDIQAIIFDMDGVITDSEPLQMEAELQTCADYGIEAPIEMWEGFKGRTTLEIFKTIVERCCPGKFNPAELGEHKRRIYLETAAQRMKLFPGITEFIEVCAARFRMALATSSAAPVQQQVFERFGFAPFFSVVTTGDEVTHGKPHPEPYLLTASRLNLPPSACAVIEDSDNGVKSAHAAGCVPLGITNSFPMDALRDAGAAFVADNYDQLRKYLGL
ncbi:MAG: HAD family phosphatase [Patescibacteria group bacterium]|nr:HAD family phosphatase [Patescibacteria group bacterium]